VCAETTLSPRRRYWFGAPPAAGDTDVPVQAALHAGYTEAVAVAHNVADPDDLEYETVRECAERGRDACIVAADLLKNGKFVAPEGDFVDHLDKKVAEIEEADKRHLERRASLPPSLPPRRLREPTHSSWPPAVATGTG